MLETQLPKGDPISKIELKQAEKFSGEYALQREVMQEQLTFYKYGSVASRIFIGVFIASCVILAVLCVFALLAPLYWSEFLQLLRSLFFPVVL